MLELFVIIALSVLAVVLAAVGVGMAGERDGSRYKNKGVFKLANGIKEEIESIDDSLKKAGKGIKSLDERTKATRGVLSALYTYVTESTGEGPYKDLENAYNAGRDASKTGQVNVTLHYLFGDHARYITQGFGLESSEHDTTWTERYLSSKEANDIYKEFIKNGMNIEEVSIEEQSDIGKKHGRDIYGGSPRAIQKDNRIIIEKDLRTKAEKKHALHHELMELYLRKIGEFENDADVEKRVMDHYLEKPREHLEEIFAAIKYYKELESNNHEFYKEITNKNPKIKLI